MIRVAIAFCCLSLSTGCLRPWAALRQVERPSHNTLESGLHIKTALFDRPAGDIFLARDLWKSTRDILDHERTTLFAQNGIRLGVVSGMMPPELERMLANESAVRDMYLHTMKPGVPKILPVNGPITRCEHVVKNQLSMEGERMVRDMAECGVEVKAEPVAGGVKLRCAFRLQYGDKLPFLKPSADQATFARQDKKASDQFPALEWECTLAPGESLVIGASEEPSTTLGQTFFIVPDPERPRRRVLLIRAESGSQKPDRDITVGLSVTR